MGTATSREVTLEASTATQRESAALDAAEAAQRRLAVEAFRKAEDALFSEGYSRGTADAVGQLDVDLAARAALAVSLLGEERAREKLVADAVAQLRRSQYRAPQSAPACVEEEAAVLACDFSDVASGRVSAARGQCAAAAAAYTRCSEGVVAGLMRDPLRGGAPPLR